MTSNILIAIKNLIENPVVTLTAHYSGKNRVNGIGNALEVYIKDLFANTFLYEDEYSKLDAYNKTFSYTGNQNNPPDIILKNGDAIEVKKLQGNTNALPLNSSYPKNKLYSKSKMITSKCKNCENWDEKDIKNKNFEADSDTIILELENGNIIKLWNSEWGGVSVIKEGIIRTDGDYAKLADRKQ